jgi:hypothetical protein
LLSTFTIAELANYLDQLSKSDIERIYIVFNQESRLYPPDPNISIKKRVNTLVELMKSSTLKGPSGDSFAMDMLRYVLQRYYNQKSVEQRRSLMVSEGSTDHAFRNDYPALVNALRRDGYNIKDGEVLKELPETIANAESETELLRLLNKFSFTVSKNHLQQAISNHTQSQWSSANAQFRTFIESLLMEICTRILPTNTCSTAAGAIALLAQSANPSFLKIELGEVGGNKKDPGFIDALFKRLHPEGSHPGISDRDDCTFRYHVSVVVAHYLLNRLETWKAAPAS